MIQYASAAVVSKGECLLLSMIHADNIYFVLVRPTYLGNIGSVARVMKNFGFKNMRLVAPPRNYKDAEARKMSVGAFDLLKTAQCFDTVAEALKDVNVAVGTTSAYQRSFQTECLLDVSEALKQKSANRMAILFGDERDGLKTEDLQRCQFVVSIPSNPDFSSLNLAQAVGIIAYELIRPVASSVEAGSGVKTEEISGEDSDIFFENLGSLLSEIEFTKSFSKNRILAELRVLFNKAKPNAREMDLLNALLKKMEQMRKISS